MGLFDTLIIEDELPEYPADPSRRNWQSKSIQKHPRLQLYRIQEGRLKKYTRNHADKWDWEDTDYHGHFTFYTNYLGEWFEYKAKFTSGELEKIERIDRD